MTGTEEGIRKGNTPKEDVSCTQSLGHRVKSFVTVIFVKMGSYRASGEFVMTEPQAWSFFSLLFHFLRYAATN